MVLLIILAVVAIDVLFYSAKHLAQTAFNLQPGDRLVITGGQTNGRSGNTNLIKIETV